MAVAAVAVAATLVLAMFPMTRLRRARPRSMNHLQPRRRYPSCQDIDMKNFRVIILVCLALMLLVALAVSRFVWLPDVITGRVVVLNSISNTAGDNMRVV